MNKILIVEDDQFMAEVYQDKFQTIGFEVVIAENGTTAIEMLKTMVPRIVLLDLMLGDIVGVRVLEFIREQPATKHVPVIVLSNAYMGNLVQAAWKAGANKCLSKTSCSPNRLVDEVRAVLTNVPKPVEEEPAKPRTLDAPPPPAFAKRAAPAAEATPLPPVTGDERVREQLRRELVETVRTQLGEARTHLHDWIKSEGGPSVDKVVPLFRAVHTIAGTAGLAGLSRLAQVASALEALVKDVQSAPTKINASVLRTITQAVELLPVLFKNADQPLNETFLSPLILVVDDDAISRETLRTALEKAQLRPITVADPREAVSLAEENAFDLVFSDIDMPEMNGFELCERVHTSAVNILTPVVFVTALSDFETRSQSTESGGADFIAKPVGLIELAVKALVHLHRGRLLAAM